MLHDKASEVKMSYDGVVASVSIVSDWSIDSDSFRSKSK